MKTGAYSTHGRTPYRVLVVKAGRKESFGIPNRRYEDNIKMDVREEGVMVRTGFI
jgi:hypothetical protein